MTLRIAITGPDGVGKTSFIARLMEDAKRQGLPLACIPGPDYHKDPELPDDLAHLSTVLAKLNYIADREGWSDVKAIALFLSMTMYGDVEEALLERVAPRVVLIERQCFIETVLFRDIYKTFLPSSDAAKTQLRKRVGFVAEMLGEVDMGALADWYAVLEERNGGSSLASFVDVGQLMHSLAELSNEKLFAALSSLYDAPLPDRVVILRAEPAVLAERLSYKVNRELHEALNVVLAMQERYPAIANSFRAWKPSMEVEVLDISADRTPTEKVLELCRTVCT